MSIEKNIRKIEGKDYVVVSSPFGLLYVQDFVRYPMTVLPKGSGITSRPFGFGSDTQILGNAGLTDATSLAFRSKRAVIFGREENAAPLLGRDDSVSIAVHGAVLSRMAAYSIVADPEGILSKGVRQARELPIGILRVDTHNFMAAEWARKSNAGLFKLPTAGLDFVNSAIQHVSTELHAFDCAAGAVNAASTMFKAFEIILVDADLSVPDDQKMTGMVSAGGNRWIWPDLAWTLTYLDAVCHVLTRNGGRIFYLRDTMAPLRSARSVDTVSWLNEGDDEDGI